jgi:hypothetical protein
MRLITICGVMNEGDQSEIWCPLPLCVKKDRLTVELALKQTTQQDGLTHSAPAVTSEFTECLVSLNFVGNDQDNLSEGVQPFVLAIVYRLSHMSYEAMRVGHKEATNYDLVTAGQANTSLSDARSLRGSTWAHVSVDMIHAEAMLESNIVVLHMMLGSYHPLVISTDAFMARYNADSLAIHHHLVSHCADHHEAKFVRYFSFCL